MWGPPSQLDLPYDVRHSLRFKDKHQRPLTDKENSILEKLKKVDPNNFGKKFKGLLTNFVITLFPSHQFSRHVGIDMYHLNSIRFIYLVGLTTPQLKIIKEYDLPLREKRVIMDELAGKTGNDRQESMN